VPADGDGYILSRVIHDWDGDAALKILHNCRTVIRLDGRLSKASLNQQMNPTQTSSSFNGCQTRIEFALQRYVEARVLGARAP